MWRLFIIYHRYIKPEFYEMDPKFDKEKIHLMQTSGYKKIEGYPKDYTSKGYITHKESEFKEYDPSLQKKKFFAPSVLYHMYKNNWYPAEYIGFIEYDFEFKISEKDAKKIGFTTSCPSVCQFIEANLKKGRIIALSARWRLRELANQDFIKVGDTHWLTYFVQEYNKYLELNGETHKISKAALLKENPIIPTQQSFICDVKSFKEVMGFIAHLIDNSLTEGSFPAPATILERYIGLCIYLSSAEVMYLPLKHCAHEGYQF